MIKYIKRKSDNKFLQSLENDVWVDNSKDAYDMTYRECENTKTTLLNTYTSEEITEVVNMFDTIHIDTSFFFPSYHVEEETDSSFVNVLKTVSQASPQLINTYVNDLQERESFVMINPKVKTVGSVLNELHYKKNQLQGGV